MLIEDSTLPLPNINNLLFGETGDGLTKCKDDKLVVKSRLPQHEHCNTTEEYLLSKFCNDYSSYAGGYDDLTMQNIGVEFCFD